MIRISQAQLARFILQKNFLVADKATSVAQVAQALVGLPGSGTASAVLAAQVRLAEFRPADLLAELRSTAHLVWAGLMRNADYVAARADYLTWYVATARQRRQGFNSQFRQWGLDNDEIKLLGEAILDVLDATPATVDRVAARLPRGMVRRLSQTSRGGRVVVTSNVALALGWLVGQGKLSLVPGSQDWRQAQRAYLPLDLWYPGPEPGAIPPEADAQASLVQAYLAAFGPATEADVSFWTGFGKSETARAVSALTTETTLVVVEGLPGTMLFLKEQADRLQQTPSTGSLVVNVLAADDPFVVAYRASRGRYFSDPSHQRQVFSHGRVARPTILVDGRIAGTWQWQSDPKSGASTIRWRWLSEPEPSLVPPAEAEIEGLAKLLGPATIIEHPPD